MFVNLDPLKDILQPFELIVPFFLQLAMKEYSAAAISAAWCDPANSYAFLPTARGRTAFSTRMLSISICPCRT